MSKRNLVVASVALAACLCWAFASSIAETQNVPAANQTGDGSNGPKAGDILFYSPTTDNRDPNDAHVPVRTMDSNRIQPKGDRHFTETPEEQAIRLGIPCVNIAYRNGCVSGCFVGIFGGPPPQNNFVDDLTLPPGSTNKFICAAQAVTSTYGPFGGPAFYNLRQQLWTDCPENAGAVILGQGDFLALPNDGADHVTTITIDPPAHNASDTYWQLIQSDHVAADIVIANDTTDPGDIGSTQNFFAISDGIPGCDLFAFGGTGVWNGFEMILLGSGGPAGSCCDLGTGACTDGVFQPACANFLTQAWSSSPCSQVNCVACNITCNIGDAADLENEPDCFTNYEDTTNRGCNNLTIRAYSTYFTPLNCNQSGCGRTGTYTYLNNSVNGGVASSTVENRRDADRYKLDLTQDTRVTWTVNGKFPSQALISFTLQQTNNVSGPIRCPESLIETFDGTTTAYNNFTARQNANSISPEARPCADAVVTAILAGRNDPGGAGPFRYMLIARPALTKLGDSALCGLPYTFNLSCEAVSALPTGACCLKTGCVQISALGCLLLNDGTNAANPYYQGDGTTCPSTCTGTPANDLCPNAIVLTCTGCVVPFDTTFAGGEGQLLGQGGAVAKDVWFDWQTPSTANSGGCTTGRITASTLYSCFNTKLQFIRFSTCSLNASQRCLTNNWSNQGTINPIIMESGPPIVNVGPWVYGKAATNSGGGFCFKIRVGGLEETDYGPGILRLDYVCQAPNSIGWDTTAGRCCFWNAGTHTGNCMITPSITAGGGPTCCGTLGGYLRYITDFYEGSTAHPTSVGEVQSIGCSVLPCPAEGEACFNAWDLNGLLGGGFGTITKLSRNRIYFKYTVPAGTLPGSGLVIDGCGTDGDPTRPNFVAFDTAMAIYRGFNLTSGECHNLDTAGQGPGNQICTGTAYNNAEIARVNDCGPQDGASNAALNLASCFAAGETDPCLCLQVVASSPLTGQVTPGQTIWIGMGAKNTLQGSTRPFIDPVRSDSCTTFDRMYSVHVANPATCFQCSLACPGGSTPEGEANLCTGDVDHYNAGCKAFSASDIHFLPISCGQTYCGTSSTYRINKVCSVNTDCGLGDQCTAGVCTGPDDNTKDYDFYRIQLTQPQRITWTVSAAFPVALQILESPDDKCTSAVALATAINAGQCLTTVAAADACPGYVYLSVGPSTDTGMGCGKLYFATMTCSSPSVAVNACCKGDMNNDGVANGLDIPLWLAQVLPIPAGSPAAALDQVHGCFDVSTCRADANNDYVVDLTDLPAFVAALLSGGGCGTTTCGDSSACHSPVADDVGVISDLSTVQFGGGLRVVDDFKVVSLGASQPVTSLCWYGFYFNYNTLAGCGNPLGDSADSFKVSIYADAGGLPGNAISGANAIAPATLTKTNTGQTLTYLNKTVTRIRYDATLPAGITVANGGCYWMEIVNKTSGACLWHWESSSNSGNGVSLEQAGGFAAGTSNYYSFNLAPQDQSFCLPGLRIAAVDCGLPLGRCCIYPAGSSAGNCSLQTRPNCEVVLPTPGQTARWTLSADCSGPCPLLPLNDNCADAILITTGPIYTGFTNQATTDGPAMSCEANCAGQCNTAPDVWYKWVSGPFASQTTVNMCYPVDGYFTDPNQLDSVNYPRNLWTYDSMLLVYDACPSSGGLQLVGGCNDDGCGLSSAATVGKIVFNSLAANTTFWIRISGWSGHAGNFTIRVNQP